MYSTRQVLAILQQANLGARVTEERLRRILRNGVIPFPSTVAGRLLWQVREIKAAAEALSLTVPAGLRQGAMPPDCVTTASGPESSDEASRSSASSKAGSAAI